MPLVQTRGAASAQGFGEFAQVTAVNYIEDVFSCFLYTGTSATQTITNDIDLAGKGGLVWIKNRFNTLNFNHVLQDSARGFTTGKKIASNLTTEQGGANLTDNFGYVSGATSTGFTLDKSGTGSYDWLQTNGSANNYVSWTFRKQPKFFDVVTYTGTGSNTTIAHNLGSVPGSIIIKRTDTTANWAVYHRSIANTQYLVLNDTAVAATGATWWNSTTPTSAVFSLGTDASVNASGGTYVAYIYAHDAGGFGLSGTDNVISCGTFTTDVNGSCDVNLGYEPQWILSKSSTIAVPWAINDTMRGFTSNNSSNGNVLLANYANAEYVDSYLAPTSTGFKSTNQLQASAPYIYIAIRRGPMKVPTLGTSVFAPVTVTGNDVDNRQVSSGFVTDFVIGNRRTGAFGANGAFVDRLRGPTPILYSYATDAEATGNVGVRSFAVQDGMTVGGNTAYSFNYSGQTYVNWMFRRAPSFFDEVCYTGTGAVMTVTHNLGVVPELIILKSRNNAQSWMVYAAPLGNNKWLALNSSFQSDGAGLRWNDTTPTSSVFSVGKFSGTTPYSSGSGYTYVAYLFATCAGVSKVGSYTGNAGYTVTVPCGFTAGVRFVLIKRTDDTGDWWVYDSARGITSGNDPYLYLNSTAAEVGGTDYIDSYSAGFEVTSTAPAGLNATGGTYIFLAIA